MAMIKILSQCQEGVFFMSTSLHQHYILVLSDNRVIPFTNCFLCLMLRTVEIEKAYFYLRTLHRCNVYVMFEDSYPKAFKVKLV